jgi:hypothetical protein
MNKGVKSVKRSVKRKVKTSRRKSVKKSVKRKVKTSRRKSVKKSAKRKVKSSKRKSVKKSTKRKVKTSMRKSVKKSAKRKVKASRTKSIKYRMYSGFTSNTTGMGGASSSSLSPSVLQFIPRSVMIKQGSRPGASSTIQGIPDMPVNSSEIYKYFCKVKNSIVLDYENHDITVGWLKQAIKNSMFTSRYSVKNGKTCIKEELNPKIEQKINFFYGVKMNIDSWYDGYGKIAYFYRGVRPSSTYNPEEWEIGSEVPQYIPFSTSISPYFALNWIDTTCFFKINAKIDENFFFLCADNLVDQSEDSQLEATLPPGVFTVKNKFIITYKGSNKTFLELDYRAWDEDEWKENFYEILC